MGYEICKLSSDSEMNFRFHWKKKKVSLKFMTPVWFSLQRFIIESHIASPALLFKTLQCIVFKVHFFYKPFLSACSRIRSYEHLFVAKIRQDPACILPLYPPFVSTSHCFRFHAIRGAACFPAWSCQRDKSSGAGSHLEGWAWKIGKMYLEAHPQDYSLK